MACVLPFSRSPFSRPPTALSFSQRLARVPAATLLKCLNEKLHIICPGFENSLCVCTFTTNIWRYPHPETLRVLKSPSSAPSERSSLCEDRPLVANVWNCNPGLFRDSRSLLGFIQFGLFPPYSFPAF